MNKSSSGLNWSDVGMGLLIWVLFTSLLFGILLYYGVPWLWAPLGGIGSLVGCILLSAVCFYFKSCSKKKR